MHGNIYIRPKRSIQEDINFLDILQRGNIFVVDGFSVTVDILPLQRGGSFTSRPFLYVAADPQKHPGQDSKPSPAERVALFIAQSAKRKGNESSNV